MTFLGAALLACYLLGAIPTAMITGRILGGYDIRTKGSGNAGATNVYRLFGLKPYLVVLMLDLLKGFCSVALVAPLGVGYLGSFHTALLCGVAAVVGHIWTIFAGFRGGKGVATAGGMLLGLAPMAVLLAMVVYFTVTLTTRYVSLGSMLAAITVPTYLLADRMFWGGTTPPELLGMTSALATLIIFTHRANIGRLVAGNENKTDFLAKLRK